MSPLLCKNFETLALWYKFAPGWLTCQASAEPESSTERRYRIEKILFGILWKDVKKKKSEWVENSLMSLTSKTNNIVETGRI